ncbi:MAG: GyrI-like domain-containing protein [Vicingaceae bacterium]
MEKTEKEAFKIIGIKIRTTNKNEQAAKDIPALWNKFMTENYVEKIPNKIDSSILAIYTNYQGDHTEPYDTIIACKVSSLKNIPEGMVGQEFTKGNYMKFIAKGDLTQGVVYNAWVNIWKKDLERVHIADFEVYGENAQNPKDAEVNIFVSVK